MRKLIFILLGFSCSFICTSQTKNDSLSNVLRVEFGTNPFYGYKIRPDFKKYNFIIGVKYKGISKYMWRTNFYYNQSGEKRSSNRFYGYYDMAYSLGMEWGNFPRKNIFNFYYGSELTGYHGFSGVGWGQISYDKEIFYGIAINGIIGLDLKIFKNFRLSTEVSIGPIFQKVKFVDQNLLTSEETTRTLYEFGFINYKPIVFNLGIIF